MDENCVNKATRGSISQIILMTLSEKDKYGYEICKDIEAISNGRLILKQSSLYSCLNRMESQGLISSYWEDSSFGGRRHYYSITSSGKELFDQNKQKWNNFEELIENLPSAEEIDSLEGNEEFSFNNSFANLNSNDKDYYNNDLKENLEIYNISSQNKENMTIDNEVKKEEIQFEYYSEDIKDGDEKNAIKRTDVVFNRSNEPIEADEITKKNSENKISWDLGIPDQEKPIFEKDYKAVIGQLYSNSRLQDPYEKNKYKSFKEIFPSSPLREENLNISYNEQFNISKNEKEEKKKIESKLNIVEKNFTESDIECEDFKNLNSLYNLQGIEIKIHSNKNIFSSKKKYTDKNKLYMVSSWIVSIIMLLEIFFSYFVFKSNNVFVFNRQKIVFFLALAFVLSFCLISSLENLFDRYRYVIIKKSFKKSFLIRVFLFGLCLVGIFAINIILGMQTLQQVEFLCSWVLPTILSSNIILFPIVYFLMYKTKNFNN